MESDKRFSAFRKRLPAWLWQLPLLLSILLMTGCYSKPKVIPSNELTMVTDSIMGAEEEAIDSAQLQRMRDSVAFVAQHHYSENFNFLVKADSLTLIPREGDLITDTCHVYADDIIAVAEIKALPGDSIDSIWVKVARDQLTFGWIHEHDMLEAVSPDDPISEFIDFFSDAHLLIFLSFLVVVVSVYVYRKQISRQSKLVHFNDIASFYPTLLCLLVAVSATLYSSIQLFGPEKWRHFYYHPTLNPYAVPTSLGLFLVSVSTPSVAAPRRRSWPW